MKLNPDNEYDLEKQERLEQLQERLRRLEESCALPGSDAEIQLRREIVRVQSDLEPTATEPTIVKKEKP
jgi:hypothetical protein